VCTVPYTKENNISGKSATTRRDFLKQSIYSGTVIFLSGTLSNKLLFSATKLGTKMQFGLVTYLWAKDWDLPTLIANCEKTMILGVELRTQHKHGVETNLNNQQRQEVKKRFSDSPVTLVGIGTNFSFHHVDQDRLRNNIEKAKEYIKLSYDVGGSGVKVKPNDLPREVPQEKTIEQIGRSLNELGRFGADYDQQIRLEVHGGCSPLPIIKSIMDVADHPNVGLCWNSNPQDLQDKGLEYNFNLVKDRVGDTLHVRELNIGNYPYQELMNMLVEMDYSGWILLEARTKPKDRIQALIEQRQIWETMTAKIQKRSSQSRQEQNDTGVNIIELRNKLRVEIDGQLFTEYNFKDVPRPFFYPLIGPTGVNITRHWPMEEGQNEEHDHPHHRSLWYAHGEVNGYDFWSESSGHGKIMHDEFLQIVSGDAGVIKSRNKWIIQDGKVICTDTRTHRLYNRPYGKIMDFEIIIHASHGQVTFGDTKEGSMAIRVAPTMRVEGKVGKGHIINSEGERDKNAWGKHAAWCDYYGPVDGNIVGVAIFDNPGNPRHPTWWHVRTYGLFAANPFGAHYFEGKTKGTGDLVIAAGESVTFKYRFYFHKGDDKEGRVKEHYNEYIQQK
jgi:sugar phosphate isomerase/epimerase